MSSIDNKFFEQFASSLMADCDASTLMEMQKLSMDSKQVVYEGSVISGCYYDGKFFYRDGSSVAVLESGQYEDYKGVDGYRKEAVRAALNMYKNVSSRDQSEGGKDKALLMASKAFSIPTDVIKHKLEEELVEGAKISTKKQ